MIRRWIEHQIRRRTALYQIATDTRIYVAIIVLAVLSGILSGVYD